MPLGRSQGVRAGQPLPEMCAAVRAAFKIGAPDVQALPAMELGGFEPPTSWVRSAKAILSVGA
jgi:hypothetical protein